MQTNQPSNPSSTNKPEKKFKAGAVSVTVWSNPITKDGKSGEYKTISLGRSYKKGGNWQNTQTLRISDIPKATVALQEAYKYLVINGRETDTHEIAL